MNALARISALRPALLLGGLLLAPLAELAAQSSSERSGYVSDTRSERVVLRYASQPRRTVEFRGIPESSAAMRGAYSVIIDLGHRQLFYVHRKQILWSAPVGIGTGLRLEQQDAQGEWEFSTPKGRFMIEYREMNPVWIAPDWHFVEQGLPVPPQNSPKRRFPGALGDAALYFGEGLAIHGTEYPDLLGKAVSHGCIRLSNANILRLSQLVQIGTEVLVVGEQEQLPGDIVEAKRKGPKPPPSPLNRSWASFRASLETQSLDELMLTLHELMESGEEHALGAKWAAASYEMLNRGIKGDVLAMEYLLAYSQMLPGNYRSEFESLLAHAYERAPTQVLMAISSLERAQRDRVAEAIVRASLDQFSASADSHAAPWPTRRIPVHLLTEPEARLGMVAIRYAEDKLRRDLARRK